MVLRPFFCAFLASVGAAMVSAQFSAGNLALIQVGDGSGALGSAGAAVSFVEVDRATGVRTGASIDLTYNGLNGIVLTGSSTGEGGFNSYSDLTGSYGVLAGYAAAVGTGSLTSTTSRRVLRVDYATGDWVEQDVTAGGQIRSAAGVAGGFMISTGSAGVQEGSFGDSSLTSRSSETNTRNLATGLGSVFYSKASGGFSITEAGSGAVLLDLGSILPADFALSQDGLALYVTSDSTTTGGIHRFTRSSLVDAWGAGVQLTTERQRHLTLVETGGAHDLYATFRSGSTSTLQAFLGAESATSLTADWTLTNAADTAFYGVDQVLAPVPEPGSLALIAAGAALLIQRRRARG